VQQSRAEAMNGDRDEIRKLEAAEVELRKHIVVKAKIEQD
jgi:hypothetical protein